MGGIIGGMAVSAVLAVAGFLFEYAIPGIIEAISFVAPSIEAVTVLAEGGELASLAAEGAVFTTEVIEDLAEVKGISQAVGAIAEGGRQAIHAGNKLLGQEDKTTRTEEIFGHLSQAGSFASTGPSSLTKLKNVRPQAGI